MFKDDDDDEEATMGATRYPVMPSLVALQQMRNRLHLAYLGKKLMKWTALATGKELRRLSGEITKALKDYRKLVETAYITLARARYFIPHMNSTVLETTPKKASVYVKSTPRSISGVKVKNLNLVVRSQDPYPFLGLNKGGMLIQECKKSWLDLLQLMVLILQYNTTFSMVEIAHKNATKRENVLKKIVVPRIQKTTIFILLELEELAREELFRIKKVKKMKKGITETDEKPVRQMALESTSELFYLKPSAPVKPVSRKEPIVPEEPIIIKEPIKPEPIKPEPIKPEPIKPEPIKPEPIKAKEPEKPIIPEVPIKAKEPEKPIILEAPKFKKVCIVCGKDLLPEAKTINEDLEERLKLLKKYLEDIISMSKNLKESDLGGFNVNEFIRASEDVKSKIKNYLETDQSATEDLKFNLARLRVQLQELIKLSQVADGGYITPNKDRLCKTCSDFERTITQCACSKPPVETPQKEKPKGPDICSVCKSVKPKPIKVPEVKIPDYIMKPRPLINLTADAESEPRPVSSTHLEEFEKHVDEVIDLTKFYQNEGLLTESAEEFLKSCKSVKRKIQDYKTQRKNYVKLGRLREQVANLERLTDVVQKEELASTSISSFLSCCKDFKSKLDGRKSSKGPTRVTSLDKLVSQIDDSIVLSKEVKKEGLIDESVDEFIKGCQQIKAKIESHDTYDFNPKSLVIDELLFNINDIIEFISKYRDEGLISQSVEDFYKTCESTRAKLELYKRYPGTFEQEIKTIEQPMCRGACDCDMQVSTKNSCDDCREYYAGLRPQTLPERPKTPPPTLPKSTPTGPKIPPKTPPKTPPKPLFFPQVPPNTTWNQGIVKQPSEYSCKSCQLKPATPETSQEDICDTCKVRSGSEYSRKTKLSDQVEDSGYYEKKVSKMTTVKRYKEKDGNIKEDYESITIKRRVYDPRKTTAESGASSHQTESYESVKSTRRVNVCEVPPQTKGFIQTVRAVKSEALIRSLDLSYPPIIWSSISAETLLSRQKSNETEIGQYSFYDPFFCGSPTNNDSLLSPM